MNGYSDAFIQMGLPLSAWSQHIGTTRLKQMFDLGFTMEHPQYQRRKQVSEDMQTQWTKMFLLEASKGSV